jgi:hypothetical protein
MTALQEMEKVVPLFQDYETVQREQYEICAEHLAAWNEAGELWKATCAAIDANNNELAKFAAPQVTLAKAEASRLLAKNRDIAVLAKMAATYELHERLQAVTQKRNDRLWGLNAVAKRSARFASAQPRRYPTAATVLTHPGAAK